MTTARNAMTTFNKIFSLADAIGMIADGQLVAFGGDAGGRRPMAAIREIIRQNRRGLRVAGWDSGIDADLLARAGCATAIEHPDDTIIERFRAGALGLPMIPSKTDTDAARRAANPHLKVFEDPFTGRLWTAVEAIRPDVAIIHADAADATGNVRMNPERSCDALPDAMIARSASTVIVTVEQIVSTEALAGRPAILPANEVTCVVEAPYGAHPCACLPLYDEDPLHLDRHEAAAASTDGFRSWLSEFIAGPGDHWAYLQQIGSERLMTISRNRAARG
jgi:glutaconate CoA-transferase subunit A